MGLYDLIRQLRPPQTPAQPGTGIVPPQQDRGMSFNPNPGVRLPGIGPTVGNPPMTGQAPPLPGQNSPVVGPTNPAPGTRWATKPVFTDRYGRELHYPTVNWPILKNDFFGAIMNAKRRQALLNNPATGGAALPGGGSSGGGTGGTVATGSSGSAPSGGGMATSPGGSSSSATGGMKKTSSSSSSDSSYKGGSPDMKFGWGKDMEGGNIGDAAKARRAAESAETIKANATKPSGNEDTSQPPTGVPEQRGIKNLLQQLKPLPQVGAGGIDPDVAKSMMLSAKTGAAVETPSGQIQDASGTGGYNLALAGAGPAPDSKSVEMEGKGFIGQIPGEQPAMPNGPGSSSNITITRPDGQNINVNKTAQYTLGQWGAMLETDPTAPGTQLLTPKEYAALQKDKKKNLLGYDPLTLGTDGGGSEGGEA